MPCFLFTWHTYGSWLPDRPEGYVHWKRGLSPSNIALAARYKEQQKETTVYLTLKQQELLIEEVLQAAHFQRFTVHAIACEDTHIHVVVSWSDTRGPSALLRSIRHSMSMRLNKVEKRPWLSRGGDPKAVETQQHFDYLYNVYLPSHSGMRWNKEKGLHK